MKKIILIAALFVASVANATVNMMVSQPDTVRIHPQDLGGTLSQVFTAPGQWEMSIDYSYCVEPVEIVGTGVTFNEDFTQVTGSGDFSMRYYVSPAFLKAYMYFTGSADGAELHKRVLFYVGYKRGDANGDDEVTISDVTTLIDYLLADDEADLGVQYIFGSEACDMDDSSSLTIADVPLLIDYLLKK